MKINKIIPLIGLLFFIYILYSIGPEKILLTFLVIKPELFLLALLFFIPRMLIYAFKWQYLCHLQKMNISLIDVIKIFLISLFYGSVTPGGVGYYIRIYYIREKCDSSLEKCITNSLIDSATGFIGGLLLSLFGALFLLRHNPGFFPTLLIASIIYLTVFIFFMKKERGNKTVQLLIKPFIPDRFKVRIDQSLESLYTDIPSINKIPRILLIEIILWIIGAFQVWIIAQSFSIMIPIHLFILMSIIAAMAGSIPISIGGLGVREGTFVYLLANYGVTAEIAFVIALSGFLVKKLLPGLIGLPLSYKFKTPKNVMDTI
jgi:uncharacterized protein (TIRG00374 family)